MKRAVILSIQGRQSYDGQDPETIELVTEGTLEFRDGAWEVVYEESALTGLEGVTTTFRVEPDKTPWIEKGRCRPGWSSRRMLPMRACIRFPLARCW